jgi:FixJ family two-component response regulator
VQSKESTVAIIDDDFRVLEALENLLISVGIETLLFSSAEQFLDADVTSNIVCMISDIEMPGMSGIDLLKSVRSTNTTLPFILISAHHENADAALYLDLGANIYFSKPFDGEELLRTVHLLVRR